MRSLAAKLGLETARNMHRAGQGAVLASRSRGPQPADVLDLVPIRPPDHILQQGTSGWMPFTVEDGGTLQNLV